MCSAVVILVCLELHLRLSNCLYDAVSNALFGNESYSFKLRLASILIIIKYEQFFDNLYREAQADTFENLIKNLATNKSWRMT
jgi:hypothetical protein